MTFMVSRWFTAGGPAASSTRVGEAALPPARLEKHLARVRDLGVHGMYYADYMMQPLEVNYHPRWRGPRGHHNRGMVRVLDACREAFGACATEFRTFPGGDRHGLRYHGGFPVAPEQLPSRLADHAAVRARRSPSGPWRCTGW